MDLPNGSEEVRILFMESGPLEAQCLGRNAVSFNACEYMGNIDFSLLGSRSILIHAKGVRILVHGEWSAGGPIRGPLNGPIRGPLNGPIRGPLNGPLVGNTYCTTRNSDYAYYYYLIGNSLLNSRF